MTEAALHITLEAEVRVLKPRASDQAKRVDRAVGTELKLVTLLHRSASGVN